MNSFIMVVVGRLQIMEMCGCGGPTTMGNVASVGLPVSTFTSLHSSAPSHPVLEWCNWLLERPTRC